MGYSEPPSVGCLVLKSLSNKCNRVAVDVLVEVCFENANVGDKKACAPRIVAVAIKRAMISSVLFDNDTVLLLR